MNHNNERKAFEEWAKWNGFQLILDNDGNGDYKHDLTSYSFKAWLASASREGYKLVPLEPTDIEIESIKEKHWDMRGCQLCKSDYIDLYKAMIGACDDYT